LKKGEELERKGEEEEGKIRKSQGSRMSRKKGERVGDTEENAKKNVFYSHLRTHYALAHMIPQRVYVSIYITIT